MSYDSNTYWENRYKKNGNSGEGSYGIHQEFKSGYINKIIPEYGIKTINELGVGDGNMLSHYKGFENFIGYDVSHSVIERCKKIFSDRDDLIFTNDINYLIPADLTMSIDVSYHIINDDLFKNHLDMLYNMSDKYILIYSTNKDEGDGTAHVFHRKVADIFNKNYNVNLIDKQCNPNGSYSALCFYLYEKK